MLDPLGRVTRALYCELLERCLFLFRCGKKYHNVSLHTNIHDLVNRCLQLITSMAINEKFLTRFSLTGQDLIDKGFAIP